MLSWDGQPVGTQHDLESTSDQQQSMDVRHYDPKNMSEDEIKMVERLQVSMSAGFVFRFLHVPAGFSVLCTLMLLQTSHQRRRLGEAALHQRHQLGLCNSCKRTLARDHGSLKERNVTSTQSRRLKHSLHQKRFQQQCRFPSCLCCLLPLARHLHFRHDCPKESQQSRSLYRSSILTIHYIHHRTNDEEQSIRREI